MSCSTIGKKNDIWKNLLIDLIGLSFAYVLAVLHSLDEEETLGACPRQNPSALPYEDK
jgi:hypothetical protein